MTAPRDVEAARAALLRAAAALVRLAPPDHLDRSGPQQAANGWWGDRVREVAMEIKGVVDGGVLARLDAHAALLEDAERYCRHAHAVVEAAKVLSHEHNPDWPSDKCDVCRLVHALSDLPPNPLERIRAALVEAEDG